LPGLGFIFRQNGFPLSFCFIDIPDKNSSIHRFSSFVFHIGMCYSFRRKCMKCCERSVFSMEEKIVFCKSGG